MIAWISRVVVSDERQWTSVPVDLSGAARFLILVRAVGDPDERIRRGAGHHDPTAWRKHVNAQTVDAWAVAIVELLEDGVPRTFNRIAVELSGRTADYWCDRRLEVAMWKLKAEGRLEHTWDAPVFWRLRRAAGAV